MTQEDAAYGVVYSWQAELVDGTLISEFDPPQGEPSTLHLWSEVPEDQIAKIHLLPRFNMTLPDYTFDKSTGIFYRGGIDLPLSYPENYNPDAAKPFRQLKRLQTLSVDFEDASKDQPRMANPSITYIIGWRSTEPDAPAQEFGLKISYKGIWEEYKITS